MTADWYYADNGDVIGPTSLDYIAGRIRQAKNQSHLVWTQGMSEWSDAKDLAEFSELFRVTPPPLPSQAYSKTSIAPSLTFDSSKLEQTVVSSIVHPWRRYFARMFDLWAFTICAGFAAGLLFPGLFSGISKNSSNEDRLLGLLFVAAYVPFEAFCLYAFGTTLGKTLYGIKLRPNIGDVAFYGALHRSFLVWFRGLGMGVPIVTLFTLIAAFNNLKKSGMTSWDSELNWSITHSALGAMRWMGILSCWGMVILVIVALFSLGSH